MKRHCSQTLKPRGKEPYVVLLITLTVKVDGIASWDHAPHLKPASVNLDQFQITWASMIRSLTRRSGEMKGEVITAPPPPIQVFRESHTLLKPSPQGRVITCICPKEGPIPYLGGSPALKGVASLLPLHSSYIRSNQREHVAILPWDVQAMAPAGNKLT